MNFLMLQTFWIRSTGIVSTRVRNEFLRYVVIGSRIYAAAAAWKYSSSVDGSSASFHENSTPLPLVNEDEFRKYQWRRGPGVPVRMHGAIDRDLIGGEHYDQRSCEPHQGRTHLDT